MLWYTHAVIGAAAGTPTDTDEYISIEKIQIPEEFKQRKPQKKLDKVAEFYSKTGHFDKPIYIFKDNMMLVDGYTRYLIAEEKNITSVPVKYVTDRK